MANAQNFLRNKFPLLLLLSFLLTGGFLAPKIEAQSSHVMSPPPTLLTESFLKQSYIGGIRTPTERSSSVNVDNSLAIDGRTADGMNYSQGPFAIDAQRNEFVFGTRYGRIVRLKMVEPKLATSITSNGAQVLDPSSYPVAPYVDGVMLDYSNSTWNQISDAEATGYQMAGFLPKGDKLLVMGNIYYDANNSLRRSIFSAEWPVTSVRPINRTSWKTIGSPLARLQNNGSPLLDGSGNPIISPAEKMQGHIAGPMAPIPAKWQSALKGDVLSAQPSGLPIITRQCQGPCAFSYWANDVATKEQPPATLALGYVDGHAMPGHPWGVPGASEYYNGATALTGMAIVEDDIIFVGYHGYGPYCYGKGTPDQSLHGKSDPSDGGSWCYDPSLSSKGTHAFPYRAQAWVYPVSVMVDIINGKRLPWDVLPTIVKLDWLPIFPHQHYQNSHPVLQPLGVAYHEASKRLYIGVRAQDGYGYEPGPLLHVMNIGGGGAYAYPTPYPSPYTTPYATPAEAPSQNVVSPTAEGVAIISEPSQTNSSSGFFEDSLSLEVGGDEPAELQTVIAAETSSGSARGGGGGGGVATQLTDEVRQNMIVNIMTQLILLLSQLIIQIKLQAANVLSAISNWGL